MATDQGPTREDVCIETSKDKMIGVMTFIAPENDGPKLTLEEIRKAIKDKGIVEGIKEEDLEEIWKDHNYGYKYIIAQGKAPIDGEDGTIEFAFNVQELREFKPKINEDGTVDLRDLNTVKNVKEGQLLATKIAATLGEDGVNVCGQTIRAKRGKEARIPKGRNTKILDDGVSLVADIDGKLEYDDHNIYINSVYTIHGDLDSSIGNIDFVGSVVVNGSIHSGFSIKAGGSVEVKGPVDDAVIIAGEDIILTYGIQGTERSKLVARGNVIAKFIQNAHVEAGNNIITEAILHSTVTAGDSIRVEMEKGLIVGGSITATNLVLATTIGSPMGTVTSIQIGVAPSTHAEYKQMEQELKEKRENLNKVDQSITFLMTKSKKEELDANKKMMLQKLYMSRTPIVEEYEEVKVRYTKLGERLNNIKDGIIKCSGKVYPGVKVNIGNLIKHVDDRYKQVTIRKVDGDILIDYSA